MDGAVSADGRRAFEDEVHAEKSVNKRSSHTSTLCDKCSGGPSPRCIERVGLALSSGLAA
jgi:hypothetical protein